MNVALVGATGVVGRQILEQFTARSFPFGELRLFASSASAGEFLDVGTESLPVLELHADAFAGIDLAIFATPAAVSCEWCGRAAAAGVCCIDLSPDARLDAERPLLVAGLNANRQDVKLCSTPASLTQQLARLFMVLRQVGPIENLLVTALAPASRLGRQGLDELQKQTGELLNGRPAQSRVFAGQLAFNCLPSNGGSDEADLADELRKVLDDADLAIDINQLQLPLFYGEGGFVRVEFTAPVSAGQLRDELDATSGITLSAEAMLPTPLDAVAEGELLVRLCGPQEEQSRQFDLWFAADNVAGSAANVVQLAELLIAGND